MAFVDDEFKADGGVSSLTLDTSITISGSNRYLFLAVYAEGVTVSSISVGAQTPTAISGAVLNPYGSDTWQIYGLVNPTVGTPTPAVTFSGTAPRCFMYAQSWDDVGTLGTPTTLFTEGGATSSMNASSSSGQTVVDFCVAAEGTISPDGTQTSREVQNDFASTFRSFGSSTKASAGASTSLIWTPAGACDIQHIAIPFSAAGGGASAAPVFRALRMILANN